MAQQFKGLWLVLILAIIGVAIFFITQPQQVAEVKPQGVYIQDVIPKPKQEAAAVNTEIPQPAAAVSAEIQDPVPSGAIVTEENPGQPTGYAVQVYSFQDKNRAQAALDVLKASGYAAFLIISDLGEKGLWYRVRVGGLSDEAKAVETLEAIRKNYNSGFIIKPPVANQAAAVQQ